ncbi:DUF6328 family protein [Streptomyces sp. NPDC058646]|uniref:DUF6328 family protein n=1 Tax=Streptomyces sp. NPDC058646 TaxID=3346574 RepID=UPI003659FFA1
MTMTEHPLSGVQPPVAGSIATPEDHGPPESPRDRVNRRWHEILQETRVAQTGVQILLGFLLSLAFTPAFKDLGPGDRALYVLTTALGASSTAALIAPVSIHRFLSGLRLKSEVVEAAGRLMVCGMVMLVLTIGCTLLLVLHVVLRGPIAEIVVGVVMLWFGACWLALPLRLRRKARRRSLP